MKINNIILVLCTRIILLSSFVIYFFRICHSGCFPIILVRESRRKFSLVSVRLTTVFDHTVHTETTLDPCVGNFIFNGLVDGDFIT